MTRGIDETDVADDLSREVAEASAWRVRLNEADRDTSEDFEAWIAASARHAQAWRQVNDAWNLFAEHAIAPEIMDARRRALDHARKAQASRVRAWPKRSWPLAAAAAAILALAIGAWVGIRPDVYTTALGERRVLKLEDGSTVTLDSDSVLEVSLRRDARRLELRQGQARFDVAHDARRPFSVHVLDRTVVATGTSFDVDLLDKTVFVTLIQGHVSVFEDRGGVLETSHGPASLVARLDPGERLTSAAVPAEGAKPAVSVAQGVALDQAVAWQNGKLIFSDEPLALVAARVSRYSSRKIAVDGAAGSLKLSGVFDVGDASGFIDAVQRVLPVAASIGGDGLIHLQ